MKITGDITPPGDKSISHRAFMLGAIAKGETIIRGCLESEDIRSTRNAMKSLGADIRSRGSFWTVSGGNLREPSAIIDAGNSGTTARLISGILSTIEGVSIVTGDSSLTARPMSRVINPLEDMGARFMSRKGGFLPMAVTGGDLKGINYSMPVASAQVKSAILLAALGAEGTTSIVEKLPTRDHTERMLEYLGAELSIDGNTITLAGRQEISASTIEVPGDPSSAAFPAVLAAATPGSELCIHGICLNPARVGFINVLERMGARISIENEKKQAGERVGDLVIKGTRLEATTIEGDEIPSLIDEIPVLVIAACLAEGTTAIRDARELRVKETDRIAAMAGNLKSLGADITEHEDGMTIRGPVVPDPGRINTMQDHRIAMAFHVLASATDTNLSLDDTSCVNISYPGFFKDMEKIS